jgi:hypothetical protein
MIIDDVISVLTTLPYPVTQAKIDPYTAGQESLPAINVKYINEKMESMGHAPDYLVNTNIAIGIFVGETETYYVDLKNIVEEVKTALFTDPNWFSNYRRVPDVSVHYEYVDGGETNYAAAYITLDIETTVSYQPITPNSLSTINISVDDISPYDPNVVSLGPDGTLEIVAPITLPQ